MDAKINSVSHVWTAIEINNGPGCKNAVGVYDLLVVMPHEDCS